MEFIKNKLEKIMSTLKKEKLIFIWLLIFILSLGLIYVYYLKTENLIRTFDSSGYWINAINQKANLGNISETIKRLLITINKDDYNLLPVTFLQPIFYFSSNSFFAYVMSIYIVYVIPLFTILTFIFLKLFKNIKYKTLCYVIFMFPIILSPQLHIPIMLGYLDVGCLLLIVVIMYHILDYDFSKFSLKNNLVISFALFILTIMRRYFIFWTIGFFLAIAIVYFFYDFSRREYRLFFIRLKNIIILGLSFSIPLIICFSEMFIRSTSTNYKDLYNGFKQGSIFHYIKETINYTGYILVIFLVLGIIITVRNKNYKKNSVIILLNGAISFLLFNVIQGMNVHQFYIVLFSILYFITSFFVVDSDAIMKNTRLNERTKKITLGIFILFIITFCTVNFLIVFKQSNNKLLTNGKIIVYSDLRDKIEKTMNFIPQILDQNNKKIYVLASGYTFNSEIFANSILPDLSLKDRFTSVAHLDIRDGFDPSFYEAQYVLTVSPLEYSLTPETQKVIGILYNAIEATSPLNDNFNLIYEEQLSDSEYKIKIYEKVGDFTTKDKEFLKDQFNKYYSEYKELFEYRIINSTKE